MRSSDALYDALAPTYEAHFEVAHRKAYDLLAWQICTASIPVPPATVVDVGCGVGRWTGRLVEAGYRAVAIEPSPGMADRAAERFEGLGSRVRLLRQRVEDVDLPAECADAVLAMGSLQYTEDPVGQISRMARWLRPGGVLAVLVDSFQALVLELLAAGKVDEALERLATRRGVWTLDGLAADLHLLDASTLQEAFESAGLGIVRRSGLLVGASVYGREGLARRLAEDFDATLALERRLADEPAMADLGKQVLIVGSR